MAITLGIIAALLSAVAIWLGYLNGAAKDEQYSNLTKEKDTRKGNDAKLGKLNKEIEGYNEKFLANLDVINKDFTKRDSQLEILKEKEASLEELKSQITSLEAKKKNYDSIIPDIGEVKRLVENLRSTKERIATLDEEITRLKGDGDALTVEIAQQNNTLAYNKRWMKNHAEFQAQEELNGKIKSIYANWGFVVLDTGDTGGVTPRSLLQVKRGEDVICELVVKNATNTAASATILFDTMKEGDFIQVGDSVVPLPKSGNAAAAASTEVADSAVNADEPKEMKDKMEDKEEGAEDEAAPDADPFAAGSDDPFSN